MMARLEACYFERPGSDGRWPRLARVLEASARRHCPGWTVTVAAFKPGPITSPIGEAVYETNTQKLDHWAAVVEASADGDRLLLIDADTMILRPLDDVWRTRFDMAYTARPADARFPLNGGVLFLRVSPAVRAFVGRWAARNRDLLATSTRSAAWRQSHGGINQASFVQELVAVEHGLTIHALPCAEWNCEDTTWRAFDPEVTRILHIKNALRRGCLSPFGTEPYLEPLRARWREAERELTVSAFLDGSLQATSGGRR